MAKYKGTGGASVPLTLDGTALTTSVPLLILNGKTNSGVEVQVTGTKSSGFVLNGSDGTPRGAFGVAAAADQWLTGSLTHDAVLAYSTGQKLRLGVLAATAPTMVLGAGKVGVNQPAGTSADVEIAVGKALTNVLGGANPCINIGVDQTAVGAGGFVVGQHANNSLLSWWRAHATAASAAAVIETSGYNNPIIINASYISLQGESPAATNVLVGTKVDDKGAKVTIVKTSAITSGAARALHATGTFNPTSGTATYEQFGGSYTLNQSGGANGTVTGLLIQAVETAVGGTHDLIHLQAGAAGTTTKFRVDNTGLITSGLAMVALGGGAAPTVGTIGGSGPAAAGQSGWMRVNVAGTDRFIPLWT